MAMQWVLDMARRASTSAWDMSLAQSDVRVAHFAFDFRAGHERRDRVDDDNVNRAAAHERVGDFQRLFARVRLGYEQVVHLHAEVFA